MTGYSINSDILSKTVGDEEVLVDLKTGTYFGLNNSGTLIWNFLKEGKNTSEILSQLKETYQTTDSEIQNDYDSFITSLKEKSFISEIK